MAPKPGKTMLHARQKTVLDDLRARIAHLEQGARAGHAVLPFGIPELDCRLPQGGLMLGSLHEIAGGGPGAVHGAAAVLFAAGILARLKGPVLWCLRVRGLFAPALAGAGLHPDTANSLHNLAGVLASQGDAEGARPLLRACAGDPREGAGLRASEYEKLRCCNSQRARRPRPRRRGRGAVRALWPPPGAQPSA
jgi:hypothetical protein